MIPVEVLQATFSPADKMLLYPSPLSDINIFPPRHRPIRNQSDPRQKMLEDLSLDIKRLFLGPLTTARMLAMSGQMLRQYSRQTQEGRDCMLPSYCTIKPTGQERGRYLALDVGGSTLRLAVVELNGRGGQSKPIDIRRMTVAPITEAIRSLDSGDFFDWVAQQIEAMIRQESSSGNVTEEPWSLGITWSFPVEQTSPRNGKIRPMGKGFRCHHGTLGQDLGEVIAAACRVRGAHVQVDAIVNDSSATLLSQAYLDPSTTIAVIVGTGANAACALPISSIAREKYGVRDPAWFSGAENVITNTEFSMFGKDILPQTRWDEVLNGMHPLPDFQPLEYMTTGRYLGEILRLIIMEAVDTCGLFDGILPLKLHEPYSLDTIVLAKLEETSSTNIGNAALDLQKALQITRAPLDFEIQFLRSAAEAIAYRASAYLAIAIHALWELQMETEGQRGFIPRSAKNSIACNGSVILKYPGFRARCEDLIAEMVSLQSSGRNRYLVLVPTDEAAIQGAAVAVALTLNDR